MAPSCASSCLARAEDAWHHAGLQVPGVHAHWPTWAGWQAWRAAVQTAAESWLAICEPRCEAPVLTAGF